MQNKTARDYNDTTIVQLSNGSRDTRHQELGQGKPSLSRPVNYVRPDGNCLNCQLYYLIRWTGSIKLSRLQLLVIVKTKSKEMHSAVNFLV